MSTLDFSQFGGFITSWQIDGREVLYRGSELKRGGIPLLFPNFDIGSPLPFHGFGRVSLWQVIDKSANSCHLRLTDSDIAQDYQNSYPYKFSLDLKVSTIDDYLSYRIEITNSGSQALPVAPGLHPYWPVKHLDKHKIVTNLSGFNAKDVDWDNNSPDYMVDFNSEFVANFPEYQLTITDTSSDVKFKHLQIWSQNTSFPDYNFVCFEPVTLPKDSLNTNPILVLPHSSVCLSLQFRCKFNL